MIIARRRRCVLTAARSRTSATAIAFYVQIVITLALAHNAVIVSVSGARTTRPNNAFTVEKSFVRSQPVLNRSINARHVTSGLVSNATSWNIVSAAKGAFARIMVGSLTVQNVTFDTAESVARAMRSSVSSVPRVALRGCSCAEDGPVAKRARTEE